MSGRDLDDWNQGAGALPPISLADHTLWGARIGL